MVVRYILEWYCLTRTWVMELDFSLVTCLMRSAQSVTGIVPELSVMVQRSSMGTRKPFFMMTSRMESVGSVRIPFIVAN